MDSKERMAEIGQQIRAQDNLGTADPMFIVQEKRRIYGMNHDYTDNFVWVDEEGNEADAEQSAKLAGLTDGDWTKTGYIDIWEFVTACFTRKGCEAYIAANAHNLNEPRIYVATAYRNREFIEVREWLMGPE